MKDKKIIITGGAGFVGSHLIEHLYKDNKIICIDNYLTGSTNNHIESKNVKYITGSAENISQLVPDNFKADFVFHLGEYSRVEQSFEDVDLVFENNQKGIVGVLEYVRKNNSKLLYAGSSTKFGDNGYTSSPYAYTKAKNTELVKQYSEWFNIDYKITYFYNVYGPREIETGKYSTLIAKFNKMMLNKQDLTVVLPGTQFRNFTHISDIIQGLILVAEHGKGDGYCIGADEAYTVEEVAKMFGGNIVYLPERNGNRMCADVLNQKLKSLGWKQQHKLVDYIETLKKEYV